jgi:hypothetical protein
MGATLGRTGLEIRLRISGRGGLGPAGVRPTAESQRLKVLPR